MRTNNFPTIEGIFDEEFTVSSEMTEEYTSLAKEDKVLISIESAKIVRGFRHGFYYAALAFALSYIFEFLNWDVIKKAMQLSFATHDFHPLHYTLMKMNLNGLEQLLHVNLSVCIAIFLLYAAASILVNSRIVR